MVSRRIVVTGSSRGIGYELVRQFTSLGHKVLALTRNSELLDLLDAEHPNLKVLQVEITERNGMDGIVEFIDKEWGEVDVLVHNAGALISKPFKDTSVEDFLKVYKVNVFAVAELTRKLDPYLVKGAHVVAISSMGGIQGSVKFPGLSAYSSSKGAVITLMELLAEEYKERGVSFNALALGAVRTEMLKEAFPDYRAQIDPVDMGSYIVDFALNGNKLFNGKVLQVSNSTP